MQRALIVLERGHIVALLVNDLPGDGALVAHGVDGDDAAFDVQYGEKLGDHRDLIGLGVGRQLPEDKPLFGTSGADPVQRRFAAGLVEGAAHGLAVDGDHAFARLGQARHEGLEAGPEGARIEQPEQPAEGIMTRWAVLQGQEPPQKIILLLGQIRHVRAPLAPAQERVQHDHQYLQEVMLLRITGPGIFEFPETCRKPFHRILPPSEISQAGLEAIRSNSSRALRQYQ